MNKMKAVPYRGCSLIPIQKVKFKEKFYWRFVMPHRLGLGREVRALCTPFATMAESITVAI